MMTRSEQESKELAMAKGQVKSNKEKRKPKQAPAKPPESVHGFKSTNK